MDKEDVVVWTKMSVMSLGKSSVVFSVTLKISFSSGSLVENQEVIFRRATTKLEIEIDIDKFLVIQK